MTRLVTWSTCSSGEETFCHGCLKPFPPSADAGLKANRLRGPRSVTMATGDQTSLDPVPRAAQARPTSTQVAPKLVPLVTVSKPQTQV